MTLQNKNLFLYILKCLSACLLLFLISRMIESPDSSWAIISAILVISPNRSEAIPFAFTRIKANVIAGLASIIILMMLPPGMLSISLAVIATILACNLFHVMDGSRGAVAAVIIIMMHNIESPPHHFWSTTVNRILFVVIGCLTGLLITYLFHFRSLKKSLTDMPQK